MLGNNFLIRYHDDGPFYERFDRQGGIIVTAHSILEHYRIDLKSTENHATSHDSSV